MPDGCDGYQLQKDGLIVFVDRGVVCYLFFECVDMRVFIQQQIYFSIQIHPLVCLRYLLFCHSCVSIQFEGISFKLGIIRCIFQHGNNPDIFFVSTAYYFIQCFFGSAKQFNGKRTGYRDVA